MTVKNNSIVFGASVLFLVGLTFKVVWFLLALILAWITTKFIFENIPGIKKICQALKLDKINQVLDSKLKSLYSFLPDKIYYIFLLRVPIISGLIFFFLPLISQFIAANFLQNIYVMESGRQLIAVMVFSTLTAIIIISLLKTILVVIDDKFNENELLRIIRSVFTVFLVLPTWILLLWLNNEKTNLEDIGWIYRFLGVIIGIIPFVVTQFYEYRKSLPVIPLIQERLSGLIIDNLKSRRFSIFVGEILLGSLFYLAVIIINYPPNKLAKDWQAPTLLYALLIIWILTLLIGFVTLGFDRSVDQQLDGEKDKLLEPNSEIAEIAESDKKKARKKLVENIKLYNHTFYWPVILLLIIFSGLGYGAWNVDHYFKLENSQVVIDNYQQDFQESIWNRLCEQKFESNKKQTCNNNQPQSLVVVAASGGGIQASGWMAQVLAGLQDKNLGIGEDFTQAIGLISSASGGSVGSMFYLDQFENGVLSDQGLANVVKNATDDWLNSVGWGLAFPDLFRVIGLAPLLQPFPGYPYLDRGYALEKTWEKTLTLGGKNPPTLDSWRKQILEGEIPIPVYNTTLVENGRSFLVSPLKFVPGKMADYASESTAKNLSTTLDFKTLYHNCGANDNQACNLALTTAARLSASFPYVTPMARNDRENYIKDEKGQTIKIKDVHGKETDFLQNYHIADGGYYDNQGAFTALDWLNKFLKYNEKSEHYINIRKVLALQINAFPASDLQLNQPGSKGFEVVTIGPVNTLAGIRDSTQINRNQKFAQLLNDRWQNIDIQIFTISFPQKDSSGKNYNAPLSWRLTQQQKNNLKDAWTNDQTIRGTVDKIKKFWQNFNNP